MPTQKWHPPLKAWEQGLVHYLNAFSGRPPEPKVVQLVLALLEARPEDEIRRRFNALAAASPIYLHLGLAGPGIRGPIHTQALQWFWLTLHDDPDQRRLRQCPICGRFFLDHTKNRSGKCCSRRCTSVLTSRDDRAAGKEREARRVTTKRRNSRRK